MRQVLDVRLPYLVKSFSIEDEIHSSVWIVIFLLLYCLHCSVTIYVVLHEFPPILHTEWTEGCLRHKASKAYLHHTVIFLCWKSYYEYENILDYDILHQVLKSIYQFVVSGKSFWVGKSSLRSWRRLATEQLSSGSEDNGSGGSPLVSLPEMETKAWNNGQDEPGEGVAMEVEPGVSDKPPNNATDERGTHNNSSPPSRKLRETIFFFHHLSIRRLYVYQRK